MTDELPMTMAEFLEEYTLAIRGGTAALFIGAGVSRGANYPDWEALLAPLRMKANVPPGITDATLAADYIEQELGETPFRQGLLKALDVKGAAPTRTHELIHSLGVRNIWTTNYDTLIEDSTKDRFLVLNDSSYSQVRQVLRKTRVIKLHGSLHVNENQLLDWREPPVITRAHFESYVADHPLLWTDLTANFLTSTFLFLGFSFDDPNVEVLLRLSRGLSKQIRRSPHFAIMKKPDNSGDKQRVADLRIRDLRRSGIHVLLIDDFDEIDDILAELGRRQLPPSLFVAGSNMSEWEAEGIEELGEIMTTLSSDWNILSLGSEPAVSMARGMKRAMKRQDAYDPERAKFYYRESPTREVNRPDHRPPWPQERVGTVIYTEQPRDLMRAEVLARSRALLLIGGGDVAADEVREAARKGLRVVALGEQARQIVRTTGYRAANPVKSLIDIGALDFPGKVNLERLATRLVALLK